MKEVKAPGSLVFAGRSVFLAGSIEMGKAVDWQKDLTEKLKDLDVTILNPRRDDWDSSWEQSKTNPQFKEQVLWELNALNRADVIVMYFAPGTMSPISLLELGLYANTGKLIVCCPEGFWRKGNVDIVCDRYDIVQIESLEHIPAMLEQILAVLDSTKWTGE